MQYYIKAKEWQEIFSILCTRKDIRTGNEAKVRLFMEATLYITRGGCPWRLLPEYYGKWRSVHSRFKQWSDKGIWQMLFESSQRYADLSEVMIDSTNVRAHACSSGYQKNSGTAQALGRSAGGFTTKIHAVVEALGYPLRFILTPGQEHDVTQARSLLSDLKGYDAVIADKAYDSDALVQIIESQEAESIIPPKRNRKTARPYNKETYKERHLIENFFSKIKHFRRIFSRFDKMAKTFLSFLHFASTLIWLR